ncbi:DUF4864 domain-containing protein [Marinovum sp. 2_MG-2023]|uniref:DUF4864 domain-containing protein n=1 Tax=unclassified Marinovum TaxID=2647166 RepID=UPI0026E3BD77|nr:MULTISPECIES: DUF4864 domain-containing protein [unclassified Marinovum]MDO6730802.1 DUF4864 domain-containing protein [Marinovum sp. 2_MG-2023]MDO6779993.1 DUF4864 domain-containing protein [Marinovum sp. 1_MG-2023]
MLRILALLCAVLLSGGLAAAQDTQPRNPEIETVIGAQLDAFKAEDVSGAFEFAAPNIRRIFRTPENFGQMVERGYPMVWRPGATRYLELADIDGRLWQRVEILDENGGRHYLGYEMIPDGSGWKIGGVQILPAPDIAV